MTLLSKKHIGGITKGVTSAYVEVSSDSIAEVININKLCPREREHHENQEGLLQVQRKEV